MFLILVKIISLQDLKLHLSYICARETRLEILESREQSFDLTNVSPFYYPAVKDFIRSRNAV